MSAKGGHQQRLQQPLRHTARMQAVKPAAPVEAAPTLFKNAKAFEAWLKKNHAKSDGLWLKIAKRGAAEPSDDNNPLFSRYYLSELIGCLSSSRF